MTRMITVPAANPDLSAIDIAVEDADFIGLYAVHPFMKMGGAPDNRNRWTATHLPSGACIGPVKNRLVARKLVKKLMPLTVDTSDMSAVFTDPHAAMDVVIVERRRAA